MNRSRMLFIVLFIATAITSVMNVLNYSTLDWARELVGMICTLGASPIVIAGWSLWASFKVDPKSNTQPSRAALSRLIRVQGLVALAGAIWIPLLAVINSFTAVLSSGWDPAEAPNGTWGPVVGLSPMVMGIAAYVLLAAWRRQFTGKRVA